MIITIQPLKKGYVVCIGHRFTWAFPEYSQYKITKFASEIAEDIFKYEGIRPTIKILPIIHTPMKSKTASTNPGNKMSTASTDKSWRPAKKKAVVAKAKKVVKAKKK